MNNFDVIKPLTSGAHGDRFERTKGFLVCDVMKMENWFCGVYKILEDTE